MSSGFDSNWLLGHYRRHEIERTDGLNLVGERKFYVRGNEATKEIGPDGLQQQIKDWCESQWPKWVYDFPRTDLKSTLPDGRHDATIWGPFPKCFLIETKAKGKKRTQEQLIWATRMRALGWEVHVLYSKEAFIELVSVNNITKTNNETK